MFYDRENNVNIPIGMKMPSAYPGNKVTIDPTVTGTTATQVEAAIAELNSNLTDVSTRLSNVSFNFISAGDSTKLPNQYPVGISMNYVGNSESGFPSTYGMVITFRASTRATQLFFAEDSSLMRVRSANGNAWNSWA